MGLGDFFLGSRPDYQLTDEQQAAYDGVMGLDTSNPYEDKLENRIRKYNHGTLDTRFTAPARDMLDADAADAERRYDQENAPGFNEGGMALAAAHKADMRGDAALRKGLVVSKMITDRGEGFEDRFDRIHDRRISDELARLGLAGSIAGQAHDDRRQGGFLDELIQGGLGVGSAFATGGLSSLAKGGGFFSGRV